MRNAINLLLPDMLISHNGPSTLSVSVIHQPEQKRVNLHLLSYVPIRKSATIDIIEERTVVRDVTLTYNLDMPVKKAAVVTGERTELAINGNTVSIPVVDGYCIVELVY